MKTLRQAGFGALVAVLVAPAALVGCGGAGQFFDRLFDRAIFGRSGGTFRLLDGLITFLVPQLAVLRDIAVAVRLWDQVTTEPRLVPGSAVVIDSETRRFEKPVDLQLRFDPTKLPSGVNRSELRIHRRVDGAWREIPGTRIAADRNVATAPVQEVPEDLVVGVLAPGD